MLILLNPVVGLGLVLGLMMDGITVNVLSLFDGMSCGQIALERAGIKVDNYWASWDRDWETT